MMTFLFTRILEFKNSIVTPKRFGKKFFFPENFLIKLILIRFDVDETSEFSKEKPPKSSSWNVKISTTGKKRKRKI